jgi:hypothetical protein
MDRLLQWQRLLFIRKFFNMFRKISSICSTGSLALHMYSSPFPYYVQNVLCLKFLCLKEAWKKCRFLGNTNSSVVWLIFMYWWNMHKPVMAVLPVCFYSSELRKATWSVPAFLCTKDKVLYTWTVCALYFVLFILSGLSMFASVFYNKISDFLCNSEVCAFLVLPCVLWCL